AAVTECEDHHQPGFAAPVLAFDGAHQRKSEHLSIETQTGLGVPDREHHVIGPQHFNSSTEATTLARGSAANWQQDQPRLGKYAVNAAPSPSALSTLSPPRWRLTMCLTIARPSPVPARSPLF